MAQRLLDVWLVGGRGGEATLVFQGQQRQIPDADLKSTLLEAHAGSGFQPFSVSGVPRTWAWYWEQS